MDSSTGEQKEAVEQYDSSHGRTTEADEQKPVNLSEASNKPPAQAVSFRVTQS